MKCLERLDLQQIEAALPPTLDPHQYACRANRSTEDATSTALHTALRHLEQQAAYARLLFVDYSSMFNTILTCRLFTMMSDTTFAFGLRISWQTDHSQSGLAHISHLLWHSAQGPTKVCWAHSSTLCIHTTAVHPTLQHHSPIRRRLWWGWPPKAMSLPTERRYRDRLSGAQRTILHSTKKQKNSLWTSGSSNMSTHHWTSMWRRRAASNFWAHTSLRTLHGQQTPQRLLRRHDSDYFLRLLKKVNLSQQLLESFYLCSIESILT